MKETKKSILNWLVNFDETKSQMSEKITLQTNSNPINTTLVAKEAYKVIYKSFIIDLYFDKINFFHLKKDNFVHFLIINKSFFANFVIAVNDRIRFLSIDFDDFGSVIGLVSINTSLYWFKTNDFLNYINDNSKTEVFLTQFLEITSYFSDLTSFDSFISTATGGPFSDINSYKKIYSFNIKTSGDEILILIGNGFRGERYVQNEQIKYLHFKTKPSSFLASEMEILKNSFLTYSNKPIQIYGGTSFISFDNAKLSFKDNLNNLFTFSYSKSFGFNDTITNNPLSSPLVIRPIDEKEVLFNYRFETIVPPIFNQTAVTVERNGVYNPTSFDIIYNIKPLLSNFFNSARRGSIKNNLNELWDLKMRIRSANLNPITFDVSVPLTKLFSNIDYSDVNLNSITSNFVRVWIEDIETPDGKITVFKINSEARIANGREPIFAKGLNIGEYKVDMFATIEGRPNVVKIEQWQKDLAVNFNEVVSVDENYVAKLVFFNEQKNPEKFKIDDFEKQLNANKGYNHNESFLENNTLFFDWNNETNPTTLKMFKKTIAFKPTEAPPTSIVGGFSGYDFNFEKLSYLTNTEILNTNNLIYQTISPNTTFFERIFIKNNNTIYSFFITQDFNNFQVRTRGLSLDLSTNDPLIKEVEFKGLVFTKDTTNANCEKFLFLNFENFNNLFFLQKAGQAILDFPFIFKESSYNADEFLINKSTELKSLAIDKLVISDKIDDLHFSNYFLDSIRKNNILFLISVINDDFVLEQEKVKKLELRSSTNLKMLEFNDLIIKKLKNEKKYLNAQLNFRILYENELGKTNLNKVSDVASFIDIFDQKKSNIDFLNGKIKGIFLNNNLILNELNNFSIILNESDLDKPFLEFEISKSFLFNSITIKNNKDNLIFYKTFPETNYLKFKIRVDILT